MGGLRGEVGRLRDLGIDIRQHQGESSGVTQIIADICLMMEE